MAARVPWSFDGYNFSVNPYEDSGWMSELVIAENLPINARLSTIQLGGVRSRRRRISGYIIGTKGPELYSKLDGWLRAFKQSTLRDHLGTSSKAMLVSFQPELIMDHKAWQAGRQSYRYQAEWISLQ